ncbi:MAG TPA: carbohydrate-binding domain-containing protein, partial [Bacteroidales bacterium]|nr:carbohydrate-binding domain-containing protein [Bacteroidales bacterium]
WSSLRGKDAAHFNLWVNDSLIRGFLTRKRHRTYEIPWYGDLSDLDSVMIQFDNDKSAWGDRNLYVSSLTVDDRYFGPFSLMVDYDISQLDGKRRESLNARSWAGQARTKLINMGIPPGKIIAVPGYQTNINKTWHSVKAFRYWMRKTDTISITGINIVSLGEHSRRTWLTYKKLLKKDLPVGIIALPDPYHKMDSVRGIFYLSKQVAAYIYYRFILLPAKSLIEPQPGNAMPANNQ